jgi:hypothetical protein
MKDEQVLEVSADVEVLEAGKRMQLKLLVTDEEGPFQLSMTIDEAAATLVALEREAA